MAHEEEQLQDEEVYINETDGLPNVHPDLVRLAREDLSPDPLDDLPKSLIVTHIRPDVFDDDALKAGMEELFREFSPTVTFQWLRSFRRLRVNYERPASAADARVRLHRYPYPGAGSNISCYFAQPVTPASARSLHPPAPVKQFLISPPSSPPLGWEPRPEHEPLVNRDLLAALASLAPGDCRELHPPQGSQPAIVVHAARQVGADVPGDCQ